MSSKILQLTVGSHDLSHALKKDTVVINWVNSQNDNYPHLTSQVDLYLIFEKSSCKNQVRQTGFLACKNQFPN
jgi:hypothetical protein